MNRALKEIIAHSFVAEAKDPLPTAGEATLLVTMLLLFNWLWLRAAGDGVELPAPAPDLLWYLTITEVITLSTPQLHRDIQSDIVGGRVPLFLLRPRGFLTVQLGRGIGRLAARLLLLGTVGAAATLLITGGLPQNTAGLATGLALAPLASMTCMILLGNIGLLAAWMSDSLPLYWVLSKFLYLFGGLLIPLSMYPSWFQSIAHVLPFESILYGPGQQVLLSHEATGWSIAVKLVLWMAIFLTIALVLHASHVKRLVRSGH